MSLSDLPDDILNLISIRLNGFDNCSLWMASNSILRQRLVNNVITDFDIKYTIPGRYLWHGNFLKKLSKLSRLSLVVDDDVFHIPIIENIEVFAMPTTLKCLKLEFMNSFVMFQTKRLISSNQPTGPTTSSGNYHIDLNGYYGNLEHLEIITPWLEDGYSIDFLDCLPQNLKSLSMPRNRFNLDVPNAVSFNTYIERLPRTLTLLNIRFKYRPHNMPYLDLSKLPAKLTSLTTNAFIDDQTYHMMPNSLKTFCLSSKTSNIGKLSDHLPTGLESLSIDTDQDPLTSQILTRLKNLQVLVIQSEKDIKLDDLINAAPNLRKLVCSKVVVTPPLSVPSKIFSHSLNQLTISNVIGISPQFISSLPSSLTGLALFTYSSLAKLPFSYFSFLPRNLKSFASNLSVVENTSLLPDNLTYLRLVCRIPYNTSYFDRLPSKLETLMVRHDIPRSIMEQLPETLTELSLVSEEVVIDDDIISMLPRGLKELSLDTPDEITDSGLADLPPNMQKLLLNSNTHITDDGIAFLPRSLMQLDMAQNPNFTDECIKHLPRRLTALSMLEATNITSKSCKDLPRYLETLLLPCCHDWDADVLIASKNELPQYIKNVEFGNEKAMVTWQKIIKGQDTSNSIYGFGIFEFLKHSSS